MTDKEIEDLWYETYQKKSFSETRLSYSLIVYFILIVLGIDYDFTYFTLMQIATFMTSGFILANMFYIFTYKSLLKAMRERDLL